MKTETGEVLDTITRARLQRGQQCEAEAINNPRAEFQRAYMRDLLTLWERNPSWSFGKLVQVTTPPAAGGWLRAATDEQWRAELDLMLEG